MCRSVCVSVWNVYRGKTADWMSCYWIRLMMSNDVRPRQVRCHSHIVLHLQQFRCRSLESHQTQSEQACCVDSSQLRCWMLQQVDPWNTETIASPVGHCTPHEHVIVRALSTVEYMSVAADNNIIQWGRAKSLCYDNCLKQEPSCC